MIFKIEEDLTDLINISPRFAYTQTVDGEWHVFTECKMYVENGIYTYATKTSHKDLTDKILKKDYDHSVTEIRKHYEVIKLLMRKPELKD
tara:strand:+ start:1808 stop:2077 length:270 start_codon:yes stop_codon:yes gene_type:complete